jgi:predicted nucleic acid-binding protein
VIGFAKPESIDQHMALLTEGGFCRLPESAYSDLLSRDEYLRVHLADKLIAASAWVKNLPLVTTNLRHFQQIREIEVTPFSI